MFSKPLSDHLCCSTPLCAIYTTLKPYLLLLCWPVFSNIYLLVINHIQETNCGAGLPSLHTRPSRWPPQSSNAAGHSLPLSCQVPSQRALDTPANRRLKNVVLVLFNKCQNEASFLKSHRKSRTQVLQSQSDVRQTTDKDVPLTLIFFVSVCMYRLLD